MKILNLVQSPLKVIRVITFYHTLNKLAHLEVDVAEGTSSSSILMLESAIDEGAGDVGWM